MSACRTISRVDVGGASVVIKSHKDSPEACKVACSQGRVVAKPRANGVLAYVIQCSGCGREIDGITRQRVDELRSQGVEVGEWDQGLRDRWQAEADRFYEERRQRIIAARDSKWAERRAFYREYIKSQEWFAKRRVVLMRDNYRCTGCGVREAAHVHHLTYEHLGDELLFELVSVCVPCHEKIHPHMREDEP